ncbi:hypothetical protein A3862_27295 [Methylobacterium sp. XJLW]|jgi:hypothetical protein|uniref:hypothetical protein n=1 Tax=Methylobacterium sp. XJLW TaxID=739141 RepID=UPI000DAAEA11|nr:hypothetical protein [Methylobacterium sp. XJLW]AWV18787.1 hypothetical protein A3862_27295 [Methylobacterium sp. XJLW]
MTGAFNWSAALLDLRARRALEAAQGKPARRIRPAPRRYAANVPFVVASEDEDENRLTPRDVLGADAFERRR